METQLYFWKPLMEEHQRTLSLVGDYYRRTSAAFEDIDREAEKYGDEIYETYPATEDTDPADLADLALHRSLRRYEALSIMKSNHLLMTISMLYHLWEQQLINFTARELRHYLTFELKLMSLEHVQIIFRLHGVDILKTAAWKQIRELKWLANTIKHGEGDSANKLRKIRPDFFRLPDIYEFCQERDALEYADGSVLLDEHSLKVEEEDLHSYIKATQGFWNEMPERAFSESDLLIKELKKRPSRTRIDSAD